MAALSGFGNAIARHAPSRLVDDGQEFADQLVEPQVQSGGAAAHREEEPVEPRLQRDAVGDGNARNAVPEQLLAHDGRGRAVQPEPQQRPGIARIGTVGVRPLIADPGEVAGIDPEFLAQRFDEAAARQAIQNVLPDMDVARHPVIERRRDLAGAQHRIGAARPVRPPERSAGSR